MINIKLNEKCNFTFDAENLLIGIWQHRDGWLKGPMQAYIGEIKFSNSQQFKMFHEMMELAIEKLKKIKIILDKLKLMLILNFM